jgi:NADP-dependent 3-hydroxy acid dehydrogenase YdfG
MVDVAKSGFKRVWFITGASRGLGALMAKAALADGNAVVAAGRNAATITERLGELPALLPVALDVTDEAQAKAAVKAAVEKFGRIDVLINNAGFGLLGAVEESTDADVRRMYDTNVFGLLNVTRAVLPVMRAQRAGHVINMSSIGGYRAFNQICSRRFD